MLKNLIYVRRNDNEDWAIFHADLEPEAIRFDLFRIKVLDAVYTEYSEEFKMAYNRVRAWEKAFNGEAK